MKKIRKAVIPAAGYGTRFLPATKATPKEMLPIVDKPTIQYIVEEALASGIEDILIVSGHGKRAIEDHFDSAPELEAELRRKGKTDLLKLVQETAAIKVHYIRQQYMRGLGDAILCAKAFMGDEPFAVLLGDDVVYHPEKPALQQLIEVYEKTGGSVLGRYIIKPEIFKILENTKPGKGGEIQLTDALKVLAKQDAVYAYDFEGQRYDLGDQLGYLKATVEFALRREDLGEPFRNYLKNVVEKHL